MIQEKPEQIALFDLDGTLCDYDAALKESMEKLRSPFEPPLQRCPRDNSPPYLRARADLIRSQAEWWEKLPKFKLGFDVWDLMGELNFRRVVLTQGPKRNPNAWSGKKLWMDRNIHQEADITITRDKGLVYGKILVDDYPDYILRWLEWRPRGYVIMPAHEHNKDFEHPQVLRYDGSNFDEVRDVATFAAARTVTDSVPPTCSMCPVDEILCGSGRGYQRCRAALQLLNSK